MIFLTVGTMFPFDRLIRAVDAAVEQGVIEEKVIAQIGRGSVKPKNMYFKELLPEDDYEQYISEASVVISHAGIGTIITALNHHKPLLVMPRMKCYKECVNDHQVTTARQFEKHGFVLAAYEAAQLPEMYEAIRTFKPEKRQSQAQAVTDSISVFLDNLYKSTRSL